MKRLAWLLSACLTSSLAMPSRAVENPYAYVVGASAVNICLVRFGYLTSDQAVELLFDAASDEGITAYQVGNLIKASGFKSDINSAIGTFGGCEQIISRFVLRKGRSKRSLTGEERFSSDIYYGPDAANEFAQFNELNP